MRKPYVPLKLERNPHALPDLIYHIRKKVNFQGKYILMNSRIPAPRAVDKKCSIPFVTTSQTYRRLKHLFSQYFPTLTDYRSLSSTEYQQKLEFDPHPKVPAANRSTRLIADRRRLSRRLWNSSSPFASGAAVRGGHGNCSNGEARSQATLVQFSDGCSQLGVRKPPSIWSASHGHNEQLSMLAAGSKRKIKLGRLLGAEFGLNFVGRKGLGSVSQDEDGKASDEPSDDLDFGTRQTKEDPHFDSGKQTDVPERSVLATRTKSEALMKQANDREESHNTSEVVLDQPLQIIANLEVDVHKGVDVGSALTLTPPSFDINIEGLPSTQQLKVNNKVPQDHPMEIPNETLNKMSSGEIVKMNIVQPPCYEVAVIPKPNTTVLGSRKLNTGDFLKWYMMVHSREVAS
ncbi:glycine dehydrogenase (decarboxylating) A [Striga asiatica]|uniref:Glycine dehydrogenase (Decarboxylating) A n=1 Tax=Striga asiatica TaxID=4170 RepID=A0A5A7Q1U3_STRAF|nr:glycine dehydrogenase (decarboxylating) A [Striga asiatica]